MRYHFLTALLLCSLSSFGQQNDTGKLRLGVQAAAQFSNLYENGITPSLTLDYRKLSFAFGPRFVYDRDLSDFRNCFLLDATFRYFPFDFGRLRPFIGLAVEYERSHSDYTGYYDNSLQPPYGEIYDHSFNGRWKSKAQTLNFYAFLGTEFTVWKGLYATVGVGVGARSYQSEKEVTNTDTGAIESTSERSWHLAGETYMLSAGCGYRF